MFKTFTQLCAGIAPRRSRTHTIRTKSASLAAEILEQRLVLSVWPLDSNPDPEAIDLSQPLPLSSTFGPREKSSESSRYDWHRGIDIPTPFGTPVYAIENGWVYMAGDYNTYADRMIQLKHTIGNTSYYSNYMHLSRIEPGIVDTRAISDSDRIEVTLGQLIGYSGDTGVGKGLRDLDGQGATIADNYVSLSNTTYDPDDPNSNNRTIKGFDHLHFEIRDGGNTQMYAVHPLSILPYADDGSGVGPAVDVVRLPPNISDHHTGTGFTDSNTLQVQASVTTSRNELDVNRVDVFVYGTIYDTSGPLRHQLVTSKYVDINEWNKTYTPFDYWANESAAKGNTKKSMVYILDTGQIEKGVLYGDFDGVYDGDYGWGENMGPDGNVRTMPKGVKFDPAKFNSSSNTYQLDVTFFDLQIPNNYHDLSVEVVAADIWGNSKSVTVPIVSFDESHVSTQSSLLGLTVPPPETQGVKNIINWTVDGAPLSTLNLPLEAAAVPLDFSGLGHAVTVNGATPTVGHDGFGAYYFDGVNDRITIANHNSLQPGAGSFSVSLWVKPDGSQAQATGLIKQEGDASDPSKYRHWGLELNSDNTMGGFFRDGPNPDDFCHAAAPTPLTDGAWNHLVYVLDREQQRINLYLNGQLDGVNPVLFDGTITPLNRPITIGQHVNNFKGSLDDILVYQRPLTSEQVIALFEDDNLRIAPEELRAHETWQASATPHNGQVAGTTVSSQQVTIPHGHQPPLLGTPLLTAESGGDLQLATVFDPAQPNVNVITSWEVDGQPLASLYLPFERSKDPLHVHIPDYSGSGQQVHARPADSRWDPHLTCTPTFDEDGGKDGTGGYVFDGNNDIITIANDPRLDPGEGDFSVSMWVKPTLGDPRPLIGLAKKGGHLVGQEYWILETDNSGNLGYEVRYNTGANDRVSGWGNTRLTLDEWNQVALVIDRNDGFVKLYLNGERVNGNTASIPVGEGIASSEAMQLGYHGSAFKGAMDEVMVFQRALSPAQITTMYVQGISGLSRIEAEETVGGGVWRARQIPHDGRLAGVEYFSNTLVALGTPVGQDVVVAAVDQTTGNTPVSVTFEEVATPGVTTVVTSQTGPTTDTGFNVLTTYYEIKTTATFRDTNGDGNKIQIAFPYDQNALAANQDESQLKLMHREDTNHDGLVNESDQWVDRTDHIDTVNNIIYGLVSSLSPFAIFVPNEPATAIAGGPYLVDEGGSVSLDGSVSTDPENDIRRYEWDFDYDGASFDVDAEGVTPVFDASDLDGPLTRDIALRIVDSGNNVDLVTTTVAVLNAAPTGAVIAEPDTVDEGELVELLLAGAAFDPADPLNYSWEIRQNDALWLTGAGESFSFTPDGYAVYVVTLTVSDDDGGSASDTVIVTAYNVGPTAVSDTATVAEDYPVTIAVLTNDSDPAGLADPLTVVAVTQGAHGSVVLNANNTVTYLPGPNYNGTDSVTYTIGDGDGGVASGEISITVTPVNDPPVIISSPTASVVENGAAVQTVSAVDPDVPSQTLTCTISGGADQDQFEVTSGNQLKFKTVPDFDNPTDGDLNNVYLVELTADDSIGGTTTQLVSVTVLNLASITGQVFVDVNQNGSFDANEPGIDGVIVELMDEFGQPVLDGGLPVRATSSLGGSYLFEDLAPGTYRLHEIQPTGVNDGAEILGSLYGSIPADNVMQLTLAYTDASDYVFAELGQQVTSGDTAGIGFWQNKHGQALINAGGPALKTWLSTEFSNVFGDALNSRCAAEFYKEQLFNQKSVKSAGKTKVDAQFMATALATYFTSSNLAGNVAASYGFHVTDTGIGTRVVSVGSSGAAFGVANGTSLTILQLLRATNALTDIPNGQAGAANVYDRNGDGIIDAQEAALRAMANSIYTAINEGGGI